MRVCASGLLLALFAIFSLSCSGSGTAISHGNDIADAQDIAPSEVFLWNIETEPPPINNAWFKESDSFSSFLQFCYHRPQGVSALDPAHLGDYGIGNGFVFAELGLTSPLNTLHSMVGPTYNTDNKYYSDAWLLVALGDDEVPFDEEWICANKEQLSLVTVEKARSLYVATVDLAPLPSGEGVRDVHKTIWRKVFVVNKGLEPVENVSLRVNTALPQQIEGDVLVEKRNHGKRLIFFARQGALPDEKSLSLPLGRMEPSQVVEVDLFFFTGLLDAETQSVRDSVLKEDFYALAKQTQASYQAFVTEGTMVETPDPVVNDFFRNLLRTLFIQISAQGGASPLSRYTSVWTRDLSGFVRPLVAFGHFEIAERILDYYRLAACEAKDIKNAYDADLSFRGNECDWVEFPTQKMTGKCAAEGPSHLPIMFGWLFDATGDKQVFEKAMPLLRRSVFGQDVNAQYLLPFSGDETFRAAMNAAFGLPLEYPHQTDSFSLVSGYLLASAALRLASFERLLGNDDNAKSAETLAFSVEDATRKMFLLPDGCRAALINREDMTLSRPFEDAILYGPWAGKPWGDDEAQVAVSCLMSCCYFSDDLVFLSPLDPSYIGVLPGVADAGIYTGMLPGYSLRALAMASHPKAEAQFNGLCKSLSPSGNYAEYMVAKDYSALQISYDPLGALGDYTARFRPWEGGINLESAFYYLTGFEPDAEKGVVILRPHLPNGWEYMRVQKMRFKDNYFDLDVRMAGNRKVRMAAWLQGGQGFEIKFVTESESPASSATLDQQEVTPLDSKVRFERFVQTWPSCRLEKGKQCGLVVSF